MWTLAVIAFVLSLLGQYSDCDTTELGLSSKIGTEANPASSFLIKHLSLQGFWLIKMIGFAQLVPILSGWYLHDMPLGIAIGGAIVAAWGFLGGIWNAINLKKAGVTKTFFGAWF